MGLYVLPATNHFAQRDTYCFHNSFLGRRFVLLIMTGPYLFTTDPLSPQTHTYTQNTHMVTLSLLFFSFLSLSPLFYFSLPLSQKKTKTQKQKAKSTKIVCGRVHCAGRGVRGEACLCSTNIFWKEKHPRSLRKTPSRCHCNLCL